MALKAFPSPIPRLTAVAFLACSLIGIFPRPSDAWNPNTNEATIRGSHSQVSYETDDDCERFKKEIIELQDELQRIGVDIERLTKAFEDADKHIQSMDEFAEKHLWKVKVYDASPVAQEKGDWLTIRGKWVRLRNEYKHEIELEKATIQVIKDLISDLLNKLANCSAKASTPSPSPSPSPTLVPPGNKNVGLLPGYHVDTGITNGLLVTTVDTPVGKIKINLPNDMAAGDTISGTVETEPNGKNDKERTQNQTELNGAVIELEGQKTKVGDKKISCIIPGTLTAEAKTIVLQYNGQTIVIPEIPIAPTQPPTPTQPTLPTGGQQGRTLECTGNFLPTDTIKIGETVLPEIASSPRKKIVRNTSDVVGPTTIECTQHGAVSKCPFRNIGIKLSADKLNLLRGETTTLHVVVMGLSGINQDVPLDLVNNSPSVISISGGNVQHINIQPPQVQPDGNAAFNFTLNGIMAGGFGITGTVRWQDVCSPRTPN